MRLNSSAGSPSGRHLVQKGEELGLGGEGSAGGGVFLESTAGPVSVSGWSEQNYRLWYTAQYPSERRNRSLQDRTDPVELVVSPETRAVGREKAVGGL
jgi:hypothetical protein